MNDLTIALAISMLFNIMLIGINNLLFWTVIKPIIKEKNKK